MNPTTAQEALPFEGSWWLSPQMVMIYDNKKLATRGNTEDRAENVNAWNKIGRFCHKNINRGSSKLIPTFDDLHLKRPILSCVSGVDRKK